MFFQTSLFFPTFASHTHYSTFHFLASFSPTPYVTLSPIHFLTTLSFVSFFSRSLDVKLLHALVNIAAALKLSAIKHPLESRDINELYDKVDASLRECMNSTSMDVPLNVMKILRDSDKDGDEAIIVRQALAFVSGPLELCIAHDLTGLLGTAQISTHGTYIHTCVHTLLKEFLPLIAGKYYFIIVYLQLFFFSFFCEVF
jgi:hypothetical protein